MASPLTSDEIQTALTELNNWKYGEDTISKEFKFNDFSQAMGFMVRVGIEAEKQVHHPTMKNVYNTVWIELNTHDAGDKVTQKDIDLAKAIEGIL